MHVFSQNTNRLIKFPNTTSIGYCFNLILVLRCNLIRNYSLGILYENLKIDTQNVNERIVEMHLLFDKTDICKVQSKKNL